MFPEKEGRLGNGEETIPIAPADAESRDQKLLRRMDELIQANADIQRSMYALAHDLQEPLRAIGTSAELLLTHAGGKLDGESAQLFDFILRGVDRMRRRILDMLELARMSHDPSLPSAQVDTRAVAQLALQDLRMVVEETGATVTLGFLPTVHANEEHLLRLFENLLGNAIKYHGEKTPDIYVSASLNGNEWVFSVKDNGIGIAPEYHSQIFEMFKRLHNTASYDGSGLGLATCKRIVQRYNGRIWVESQAGDGATFYFTLPAEDEVAELAGMHLSADGVDGQAGADGKPALELEPRH